MGFTIIVENSTSNLIEIINQSIDLSNEMLRNYSAIKKTTYNDCITYLDVNNIDWSNYKLCFVKKPI